MQTFVCNNLKASHPPTLYFALEDLLGFGRRTEEQETCPRLDHSMGETDILQIKGKFYGKYIVPCILETCQGLTNNMVQTNRTFGFSHPTKESLSSDRRWCANIVRQLLLHIFCLSCPTFPVLVCQGGAKNRKSRQKGELIKFWQIK